MLLRFGNIVYKTFITYSAFIAKTFKQMKFPTLIFKGNVYYHSSFLFITEIKFKNIRA